MQTTEFTVTKVSCIYFLFFYPSAPKVHGYKGSWQDDFYCRSVMIATEKKLQKHSAGVTSVIHPVGRSKSSRWSVFNAENYSRSGVSVAPSEYKLSLQKTVLFHSQKLSTHTNMNWDSTNEMYGATKQHKNTHIYTDQISHHIHKQTPPADAAALPVSGVVHCDLSA